MRSLRIVYAIRRPVRSSSGFTLLEMMLTVALVAITATFVSLSIGGSDARLVELEARRFVALVNMALDESIMTGRPLLLTVDAASKHYQFAPLDVPAVFAKGEVDDSEQAAEVTSYAPEADAFFKLRQLPDQLTLNYTRLPDRPDPEEASNMVPQRVHEVLNQRLFDDERDEIENPYKNAVLIEPNGLISPFELVLGFDDRVGRVGLDTYGRATVLEIR